MVGRGEELAARGNGNGGQIGGVKDDRSSVSVGSATPNTEYFKV